MLRRVTGRFFFILLLLTIGFVTMASVGACTPDTDPPLVNDSADLDSYDLSGDTPVDNELDSEGDEVGRTGGVIINEIAATNSLITDPDYGDTSDWIELYNDSDRDIPMAGYELSDREEHGEGWFFPGTVTLPAHSYLVVWADNQSGMQSAAHTNFALDASGEIVCLTDTAGTQNCVSFDRQIENTTLARFPGEEEPFQVTYMPTPGAENLLYAEPLEVALSPPGGRFESTVSVEVSAPQADAIYYTLDGSPPTDTSERYDSPIELSDSSPLRAVAIYSNGARSPIVTDSYFVGFSSELPILDLILPPDALFDETFGILVHPTERGSEWERAAVINWIRDDEPTVSFQGGLRIHGGFSRKLAKNSFRIYLRDEYGPDSAELEYFRVFGTGSFTELVMSSVANDGFLTADLAQATFIRDALVRDTILAIGEGASDGFFISLHLNGEYWGLYEAVERINEDWLEQRFGGEQWDIIKGTTCCDPWRYTETPDEGDLEAWNDLMEWVDSADPDDDTTFNEFDNFVNYTVVNVVGQNHDWPHNNWIAVRPRTDDARWRWVPWDSQWSFGLKPTGFEENTLTHASDPQRYRNQNPGAGIAPVARIINLFLATDEGRLRFIEHLETALNWEMSSESMLSLLDSVAANARPDISLEAERWAEDTPYTADQLVSFSDGAYRSIREFFNGRPDVVREFAADYLDIAGVEEVSLTLHEGCGSALVNGREVQFPWTGTFFAGSAVTIEAVPCDGYSFDSWDEDHEDSRVTIEAAASGSRELTAEFDEDE